MTRRNMPQRRAKSTASLLAVVWLMLLLAAGPVATAAPAEPAVSPGVLAYVRPNDATGDEIWFVRSDGTDDHRIFTTGKPDPFHVTDMGSLAWKKDATELAFDSDHEFDCSFYDNDIFSIRPDGSGYRRITQSPGCAALAAYPQGSVTVPVRNYSPNSVVAFVYFQGARTVKQVSLPAFGSGSVTFEQVADLLDNDRQIAISIIGAERDFNMSSAEVIPGQHVIAEPALSIGGLGFEQYGARWPTWHLSGTRLAYVLGSGLMFNITAQPGPLQPGNWLLNENADRLLFASALEYGPTSAFANQFLYSGWDVSDEPGIWLGTEGGAGPGQKLVSLACCDQFTGVAWLPDASGFVYSRLESSEYYEWKRANVYEYRFATQQSVQLSNLADGQFAADLSVSADGQHIAFEVSAAATGGPYDLWLMNRNGSNERLFRAGASSPAWSPVELPVMREVFLPLVLR
jgi:hypothetical protein